MTGAVAVTISDGDFWKIGRVVGGFGAVLTFFGSWVYCTAAYGFLFGFGLGWLPALILASIVGTALVLLWPLVLLAIGLIVVAIVSHM